MAKKDKTKSVEKVIMALEDMYKTRISRSQQDSQEFLHLIHEALDKEDTRIKKHYPEQERPHIARNPFEGELSTQIKCRRCGFVTPWKKEAFTELSVAVPSKVFSLRGCVLMTVALYTTGVSGFSYHHGRYS